MAGRALLRMNIDSDVLRRLTQQNFFTAKDVTLVTPLDLCELLDLPMSQVKELLLQISSQVAPPFTTALQLHQVSKGQRNHLPTSVPGLNCALRGGIPAGGITELVGPAGVGKSQVCFMLTLLAAMPVSHGGLERVVIFIDTEKKFSSQRLVEMAGTRGLGVAQAKVELECMLTRILVMTPSSVDELARCLQRLEVGVPEHKAGLVVVDSIAALMRGEFGARGQVGERQEVLGQQAAALKNLAENFQIPVVVTNQVTTRIQTAPSRHSFQHSAPPAAPHASHLTAALGTKWAHCVNTRLVLERLADRRFLKIAKSPSSANAVFEYRLAASGVEPVEGGGALPATLQGSVVDLAIANEVEYGMYL